jgi:RpiR family carbohydrate utilization transcriptional regulator
VTHGPGNSQPPLEGGTLLEVIAARRDQMRPSDAKVADVVLAGPLAVMDLNLAGLAAAAGVSEPTVIRFCGAIGFDGYRAFKLALAGAVALGLPAENASIRRADTVPELVDKVFRRTISSLDRARRGVDLVAVEAGIGLILQASDLLFLGLGASGIVAQDAAQKFPLFGLPCQAPSDAHQQYMAASLATPGTVVVAISETAATAEVVRAAQAARAAGGHVIALTGNDGPLGQVAEVEIRCATFEDTDLFTPTVSRLAALVVIDVLASGVAVRRPPAAMERVGAMRERLSQIRAGRPKGGPAGPPATATDSTNHPASTKETTP